MITSLPLNKESFMIHLIYFEYYYQKYKTKLLKSKKKHKNARH